MGLTGGDASITIGYSRFELKVDLGYARAATLPGAGRHNEVLSYLRWLIEILKSTFKCWRGRPGEWSSTAWWGRIPSRGLGFRLGLGGRRGSPISGDGCDSHSYWCGLHERVLLRSTASTVYPFVRRSRRRRLSLIKRNLPENSTSVRNGAVWLPSSCEDGCMSHRKAKKAGKEPGDALRASVKKEMAEPRMAKSARTMERTLDRSAIPVRRDTTLPGTVDKIMPPRSRKRLEKA